MESEVEMKSSEAKHLAEVIKEHSEAVAKAGFPIAARASYLSAMASLQQLERWADYFNQAQTQAKSEESR